MLKGLPIDIPDKVWATDITYIRLAHGFVYLVAVIDWHSRYVLSWELSTTLDAGFCLDAVQRALQISKPEIFNTDQGAQFTSTDFTGLLKKNGVKVSIDGRGRVFDNIFIERLWRSVKYEEVFLHEYQTVAEAKRGLGEYFRFYNEERLHEALGYRTPHELYFGTLALGLPTAV
jgi:putative transposase